MKNKTAVDLYIIRRHEIEIQSRLGKISAIEYDEELRKAEQEAKTKFKEQIRNAYCHGEFYQETKLTEQYYKETYGGE
jgi:hypothetical protein